MRIGGGLEIVVGTVGTHPAILFLDVRVAPLDVFLGRQRERGVEHRVQHVDERHLHDRRLKKIRALVEHGAHQQAARAAAGGDELLRRGPTVLHKPLRAVHEIVERIHLLVHAPGLAPLLAEFAATADVRDGVDHAAVEQRHPRGAERVGHAHTVGAVAVEVEWLRLLAVEVGAVDEIDRDFDAVARNGPHALGAVVLGVETAENLGRLDHPARAGLEVRGKDGRRPDERLVAEAIFGGVVFPVAVGVDLVGHFGHLQTLHRVGREIVDGKMR